MRKCLVTGASSGIGRAIALRLLDKGEWVVGVARDFSGCEISGDRFIPLACDLAELDALPETLTQVAREHADVSAVILCAGSGRFGSLEEFSFTQIRALVDLNTTSTLLVARAFVPVLKRRRAGNIVFLGSEAALAGGKRGAVYSATKFALRGFAQSLRQECAGSGVHVTLVNPGITRTGFFDGLDFAPGDDPTHALTADDIADVVLHVLATRPGTVVDEVNLSPLKKVIRSRRGP